MRARRVSISSCAVAVALWLHGPVAAANSAYCTAFFDHIADTYDATYTPQYHDGGVDSAFAAFQELPAPGDGVLTAIEIDAEQAAASPGTGVWELEDGDTLALCVDGPWEPPAILLGEGAALGLARPKWTRTDQSQEIRGIQTLIHSNRGTGIVLHDATVAAGALAPDAASALLVLQHTIGPNTLSGLVIEDGVESSFSVVRQWKGELATRFAGSVTLSNVRWEGVPSGASLYRAACPTGSDILAECEAGTVTSLSVAVSDSTFIGASPDAHPDSFIEVVGDLTVSRTVLRDLSLTDPAIESTGQLVLNQGSALINVTSQEGAAPAVKAGSAFRGDTVLFSDVDGWQSVVRAGEEAVLEQSYACGVSDAHQLMEVDAEEGARVEVVSTAVLESRFTNGLVDAQDAAHVDGLLANLTLLDVQTLSESEPEINLVKAPETTENSLALRNLLASESALVVGPHLSPDSDRVRIWHSDVEQTCSSAGIASGCVDLDDAPRFSNDSALIVSSSEHTCSGEFGLLLADLMQAEDGADRGEASPDGAASLESLTVSLRGRLPALLEGQPALIGAGVSWSSDADAGGTACLAEDAVDVGAYSGEHPGSCTLSFLAPVSLDTGDTGDTGLDSAGPDALDQTDPDTTAESSFGLGRGCRYGSAGALLLLPLATAARRRWNQSAAG